MMQRMYRARRTLMSFAFISFAFAAPSLAQTPPALRLSDGVNTVTIDANNVVTFSPGCACSTVSSSGVAGNPGRVAWMGTIGVFDVAAAQGNAQNSSFANPDLSVVAGNTSANTATLTVSWSSAGYNGSVVVAGLAQTNFSGAGSAKYSYYIDDSNALFGTGSLVGTFSATTTTGGPIWPSSATGTFSATEVEAITLGPASVFNGDNEMAMLAEPITVSCAVSSGT